VFPIAGLTDGPGSYLLPGLRAGSAVAGLRRPAHRTSLVENLRNDYVRTAKAQGAHPDVDRRQAHAAQQPDPGGHLPRRDLGVLLSGAIVTEGIFNIPGLGRAVFDAVRARRARSSSGIVTLFVFFYIFFNLVVDVLYAALDPRIRYD
jgi:ABC-type dipeptide/oligopeptide/nickel transport system permease component